LPPVNQSDSSFCVISSASDAAGIAASRAFNAD